MVAWWNLFQGEILVVAFGGIDGRSFGIAKGKMFDGQNNGMEFWWRLKRIEDYWENFQVSITKVNSTAT